MLFTRWTKHLPKDEHEDFRKTIRAHRVVLDRLKELLEEDLEACKKSQSSKIHYRDACWPMFQADHIGEQRALEKVIKLITLDEEK